jgi:ribosomal protein S6
MAKKKETARVVEAENKMYELMIVLQPELLESAVEKKLKEFDKFLEENGGKVTMKDVWGKQKLAYRIGQFDNGIYVVYNLELPTTFIKELDEHLRIEKDAIRHLLMTIDSDYEYSRFDEIIEEPKEEVKNESPKKSYSHKADSPKKPEKKEEEVKETEEKAEEKEPSKEKKEVSKDELDDKLGKILDGDDITI